MKHAARLLGTALLLLSLTATASAAAEQEVRQHVMDFNQTYADNQLDAYFEFYADDATLIFGQERTSVADYSKSWHELIASGGGVRKNAISDIQVRLLPGEKSAVATYHIEVHTEYASGEVVEETAIETDVWIQRDGGWKIVSLHYSPQPKVASPQTAAASPDAVASIDPVAVSPDQYQVLLDNDHVRVVRYELKPGEQDNWHTHPAKTSYVLSGGRLRISLEDGTSFEVDEHTDHASWMGAIGKHRGENVGAETVRILFTEIKGVDEVWSGTAP